MQAQRIASASLAGPSGRSMLVRLDTGRAVERHAASTLLTRRRSALRVLARLAESNVPAPGDGALPLTRLEDAAAKALAEAAAPMATPSVGAAETEYALRRVEERKQRRQREQMTYQFSAVISTLGMASLAIVATYLRFQWHIHDDEFPWAEFAATLTLVAGGVIGMEMWARYAHKALWHDFEPGWKLHKSHHMPRVGPFEDNDIFAIINAVPAMALCAYGFVTPNMLGGVCFGAGLGITLFGIMYMFIHDGLVHRRFPVGPIAEVPYLKRVAMAHTMHHAAKWGGAPWGMFLGPQELDNIPGAREELDRLVAELDAKQRA